MGVAAGRWRGAGHEECQACKASAQSASRPPSREQIGRAAWRYIHSMATEFPENPSVGEQVSALAWLRAFLRFYPCHVCAQEFIDVCHDLPPRFKSKNDYVMWWCEAHNRVRSDLSQTPRRCDLVELLAVGAAGATLDEMSESCKRKMDS
mmetsp:Transcript_52266/g.122062  ORF Transcript_52266/g.122062 Transcript_52266/m.122062 type:complete len:150 (-) Transcript_52266:8-457(-)